MNTARLADLQIALDGWLRREVEHCPAAHRENARDLVALVAADYRERLLVCDSDADAERLTQAWVQAVAQ